MGARPPFDQRILARLANVVLRREQMHQYQWTAYEFLRHNPFSALFIDMGMGKTITSLTLACDLLRDFETDKVLIIGPLKVATDTWPTEIGNWEHTAPFNYTLIREDDDDPRLAAARARASSWCRAEGLSSTDAAKVAQRAETKERERIRAELAHSRASIHIINREAVEWLVNLHREKWPYRTVIIDESSSFKDHKTERFKALAKVRNTPGLITRLHQLTATPAAESYEHLFAQMYLLDRGERLGKKITHYRDRYFTFNRYSRTYKLRPGAEEEVLEKIKDICLVMKAEDYLPMEKPTIVQRPVKISYKQLDLYKRMERDSLLQLDDGTVVEAENAAALSAKLLQMASGVLYETQYLEDWDTGDMNKVTKVHHLHDHKIDTLREIIESLDGEPVLVSYHFKSSLARLQKAFPKAVVLDKEGKAIKRWNARKIPILLVHPQSAGHGLNLQHGGHNLVMFDLIWSLELYLQLIGRLARQGQKHPVLVQILTAVGTLDEAVCLALHHKEASQDNLFRLLKRLIKAARGRMNECAVHTDEAGL
jgi:hypothetical protein